MRFTIYVVRDAIHDKVTKEKRSFRNSEIRHLETIEKEIKDLIIILDSDNL